MEKRYQQLLNKRQYLKEMGIDVWVRRPAVPSINPSVANPQSGSAAEVLKAISQPELESAAAPEAAPMAVPARSSEPVPRFRMAFMHYGDAGLVVMLADGQKVPRRLCDDLARFMGGDPGQLRYQELEWPMVKSAAIDQSLTAAREVVAQKILKMPARLLLAGQDVCKYYDPARRLEAMVPGGSGRHKLLLVSSFADLMDGTEAKRSLMLVLHDWI